MGTDPTLIEKSGLSFASIRAVVVVGGRGFDIPKRISENPDQKAIYTRFYGDDPRRPAALVPGRPSRRAHARPSC